MSDEMLRRLAEQEAQAEILMESVIPYDAGLLASLDEHGPSALQEYGQIVVRGTGVEAVYNSALWWAHAHDLTWENRPQQDCVILTEHPTKGA